MAVNVLIQKVHNHHIVPSCTPRDSLGTNNLNRMDVIIRTECLL